MCANNSLCSEIYVGFSFYKQHVIAYQAVSVASSSTASSAVRGGRPAAAAAVGAAAVGGAAHLPGWAVLARVIAPAACIDEAELNARVGVLEKARRCFSYLTFPSCFFSNQHPG